MDTQTLQTKDFDFELPEELIAQTPIEPRDASRLMVLDKTTGEIEHRRFHDITEYLNEGDCLVLNNSRVLPARIYGIKNETGAHVEFLLLKNCGDDVWEALAGPGKRAKVGTSFTFEGSSMTCEVIEVKDDGNRMIRFHYDKGTNFFTELATLYQGGIAGSRALPDGVFQRGRFCRRADGRSALYAGAARCNSLKRCEGRVRHTACRPWHIPPGERG